MPLTPSPPHDGSRPADGCYTSWYNETLVLPVDLSSVLRVAKETRQRSERGSKLSLDTQSDHPRGWSQRQGNKAKGPENRVLTVRSPNRKDGASNTERPTRRQAHGNAPCSLSVYLRGLRMQCGCSARTLRWLNTEMPSVSCNHVGRRVRHATGQGLGGCQGSKEPHERADRKAGTLKTP